MDARGSVLNPVSRRIIGCALTVAGALGTGFLEKVHENALAYELQKTGIDVERQRGMTVMYDGISAGEYFVDLLAEQAITAELKTVQRLNGAHRAQCLNYLRAAGLHLCRFMNSVSRALRCVVSSSTGEQLAAGAANSTAAFAFFAALCVFCVKSFFLTIDRIGPMV